MALSIKDPEVDKLARKLAKLKGEKLTETIFKSLQERYEREKRHKAGDATKKISAVRATLEEIWKLPVYDTRTPDEIMGFNERGVFD